MCAWDRVRTTAMHAIGDVSTISRVWVLLVCLVVAVKSIAKPVDRHGRTAGGDSVLIFEHVFASSVGFVEMYWVVRARSV